MAKRIMRLPEVREITGLSKSNIYYRMERKQFPMSVHLGGRAVGWLSTDIEQWIEKCAGQIDPQIDPTMETEH